MIFAESKEKLKEQIKRQSEEIDNLKAENSNLASKIEQQEIANCGLQNEIKEAKASITQLEALNAGKDTEIADLKVELDETEKSTAKKAAKIISSNGFEAVNTETEESDKSEEILREFLSMKAGSERSAFYQKNKNILNIL